MKYANEASATSLIEFLRRGFPHRRIFSWLTSWKRPVRLLRVRETLSLGNRGLIAVVEFQQQQFLVGCTTNSIALLARLAVDEVSTINPGLHGVKEE